MTATVPGMADKGWTARIAAAAGVAAGTGAAQLGLGYGLGVVVWPVATTTDPSVWLGSLGWATWITASATVFGAVIATRLGGSERPRGPLAGLFAISAGLGALVAVALIALPARDAVRLEAHTPQAIAGAYALIGVVLGVVVAYWAVRSRPVGANLIATAAWLWALAITAIVIELSVHRDSATYLTSWQFSEATSGGRYGTIYWPSALLTIGAAFLIGILAATPAVSRGDLGVAAATSGAVGPLLVAASFLVLSPRLTGDLGPLESAYLIAPYAVLAGLAGSALTVASARSLADRRSATAARALARGPEAAGDRPATPSTMGPAAEPVNDRTPATGFPAVSREATDPDFPAGSREPGAGSAARGRPTARRLFGRRRKAEDAGLAEEAAAAAVPVDPWAHTAEPDHTVEPAWPGGLADEPKAATPAGRAKLPTQPPANPTPQPGARTPQPAGPPPQRANPVPQPTNSTPPPAGDSGERPKPSPVARAKSPKPVNSPPKAPADATDPEIAAAARPGRGRKATAPAKSAPARETKSTVTPPPQTPTIAQINPKPPAEG
ncbi:Hansenula MRAKII killer toxin-resistant protein 1 [Paractinoplanes ferrugineus]|uniref:Hansenula MRAKII killer toxin-resistant protein 1 n=1 Tax=Paractinoplanes ferrugineus TaxID=113564 RepID=UPI001EF286A2|nr:Hansenula MRAKII killer toxin-resistant protein 1 [Actinoplanes ferrugineus]